MEQTRSSYLMWSRRKVGAAAALPPLFGSPPPAAPAACHESWEEQAFAEDSSGLLGGCVWPPRSYSCSFCRREFRSAQALGGHMNVHRRDRATLKQSSPGPAAENLGRRPARISTAPAENCYNPNPNPNPNSGAQLGRSSFPTPRPFTDDLMLGIDSWKPKELAGGLGKRGRRAVDDDDAVIGNKRRRFDPVFPFVKPPPAPPEVLELGPSPVEELDLELRLGDPPKIK